MRVDENQIVKYFETKNSDKLEDPSKNDVLKHA